MFTNYDHLSPALASFVATTVAPRQHAKTLAQAVAKTNSQTKVVVKNRMK